LGDFYKAIGALAQQNAMVLQEQQSIRAEIEGMRAKLKQKNFLSDDSARKKRPLRDKTTLELRKRTM
jgi:regulator of replication initiation timing